MVSMKIMAFETTGPVFLVDLLRMAWHDGVVFDLQILMTVLTKCDGVIYPDATVFEMAPRTLMSAQSFSSIFETRLFKTVDWVVVIFVLVTSLTRFVLNARFTEIGHFFALIEKIPGVCLKLLSRRSGRILVTGFAFKGFVTRVDQTCRLETTAIQVT